MFCDETCRECYEDDKQKREIPQNRSDRRRYGVSQEYKDNLYHGDQARHD